MLRAARLEVRLRVREQHGAGGVRDVFTLQKRQPRVHVSPSTMIVAVAAPFLLDQHSPMFGQRASSHTVASFFERSEFFSRW